MNDYVIVGAGSAGCVLANRLTEDPDTRVLLLEAGEPDKKMEVKIPAAFPKLFTGPLDWNYQTGREGASGDRSHFWPRGKTLGGSSSMNAMIYMRGDRSDYDRWRDLGNEGWGFEDVLPYFKRSENNERGPDGHHGVEGPLNVADLREVNPLSEAFVEASVEAGFSRNPDFNGAQQEGFGLYQVTQKNGRRHSTADAYLRPAMRRPNLTVITGARTTRVLWRKERAAGVEYVREGRKEQAFAREEVILSGGAVNSPQTLLLSGVGPVEQLAAAGIPVVRELPGVGRNLQDHPMAVVSYECEQPVSLGGAETLRNLVRYLLFKKGPLTSNVAEAGGFVRTSTGAPVPELQFLFAPAFFMDHGFANPEGHGFSIASTVLRPRSRGSVELESGDPLQPPLIRPGYLTVEDDLEVLVEGVKLARRLAGMRAFDPYRGKEVWPGEGMRSDAEIASFVRERLQTLYHPVGTCKMGRDPMAVVDERLRVYGVEGLRVADGDITESCGLGVSF